ncbi:phosphate acetyltransferase [Corynebacterium massiliense]|uniref:Phosphate acetyltransferase n=1 Tax=Corynebacterium massiliense DSM 45435 TaxID=1121364 RepID=A0ABY7U9A2_9CORY|nr:phosphate acetyltransferase [Corynebacterium massiliense]WCZ33276.1 Phosphate acetyltransferase [Corynebacterium massiliense DSM 45435]
MSDSRSAVLSPVAQGFADVDLTGLASQLGVTPRRLSDLPADVAGIINADLEAEGPVLLEGSGDNHFDAEVAAALGIPLVLVAAEEGRATELVERHAHELGATVAGVVSADELSTSEKIADVIEGAGATQVVTAPVFEKQLVDQAKKTNAHIVLPEGEDDRIVEASGRLLERGVARLTILGKPEEIKARAEKLGVDISAADLIDHETSELAEEFAADFAELRKKKGITLEQARETMRDISYFATMMVHKGLADGMVSGAAHTTAHTIKPSFQIIKTSPDASVVSSIFLMVMRGRVWAFGDCAVNPNPTAEQLGEIAVVSAKTASQFGLDPRVAMLSYSTGTSGSGPDVDRAVEAVKFAREKNADLKVDGPLQFDAACDAGVAQKKAPDSPVAGQANVFIFPDLEAGNAGYKIAQRTGGALAIGPILQGLNKPVNDLSRGATVDDIVNTVAITAIQAGEA